MKYCRLFWNGELSLRQFGNPSSRRIAFLLMLLIIAVFVSKSDSRRHYQRGDFTRFTLAAARLSLANQNPYDKRVVGRNYKYPPLNIAIIAPLTLVDTYTAQGIWTAINFGLLLLTIREHARFFGPRKIPLWVWALAFGAAFRFFWENLKLGQWNTSVYCCTILGLARIQRKAVRRGAMLVGFASVLKYWPISFLLYFSARKQWRIAGWIFAAIIFMFFVVPSAVFGPRRNAELLHQFVQSAQSHYSKIAAGKTSYSVSGRSTIYRMLTPAPMKLDNIPYDSNLFNLKRNTASLISNVFALGIVVFAFCYIRKIHTEPGNQKLLTLLLIGFWISVVLTVSPGVREAHLLATFTPLFAIGAAIDSKCLSPEIKRAAIALALSSVGCILICAEISDSFVYHDWLRAHGCDAIGVLLAAIAILLCLNQLKVPRAPAELQFRKNSCA
jgi:hypothetical protein